MSSTRYCSSLIDKIGRYKAYSPQDIAANRINCSIILVNSNPVIIIPAIEDVYMYRYVENEVENRCYDCTDEVQLVDDIIHQCLISSICENLTTLRTTKSKFKKINYMIHMVDDPIVATSNSELITDTDFFISPPIRYEFLRDMIARYITTLEYTTAGDTESKMELMERKIRSYQDQL